MTMRLIVEPIVRAALLEDLGRAGDITTEAVVPTEATVEAVKPRSMSPTPQMTKLTMMRPMTTVMIALPTTP